MLKEDQVWVLAMIKEEIVKIQFPIQKPPKPVEVDIDGIVKKVLDKIKVLPAEVPKKGK
jgi:hypothetical protein